MNHPLWYYLAKAGNFLLMVLYLLGGVSLMTNVPPEFVPKNFGLIAVGTCLVAIALFGSPYVDAAEFDPI